VFLDPSRLQLRRGKEMPAAPEWFPAGLYVQTLRLKKRAEGGCGSVPGSTIRRDCGRDYDLPPTARGFIAARPFGLAHPSGGTFVNAQPLLVPRGRIKHVNISAGYRKTVLPSTDIRARVSAGSGSLHLGVKSLWVL
jgi:hypothetical protein